MAQDAGIALGVVNLKTEILPKVAHDLEWVVGDSHVQTAELLKEALRFPKTAARTPRCSCGRVRRQWRVQTLR